MSAERILAVNPGSTSTKVAAFTGERTDREHTIRHADEHLLAYRDKPIVDQLPLRLAGIDAWLHDAALAETRWAAACARGGLLPPLPGGTYAVNAALLAELRAARRGQHASNLGAFLAAAIAERSGCPAYIVDPVSVDELEPVARLSGLAGLERESLSHALNTKATAKRYARDIGRQYPELRLVVAHLGSGISISAHRDGRMIDVNNAREEGPFSAERTGGLPTLAIVQRAITEGWSTAEAERQIFREGGIFSYLHTRDLAAVLECARHGNAQARLVIAAMLYQVAKEVGAMASVLQGNVDAVLLTGGMANARFIVDDLKRALGWIAPVHAYPGEAELPALAAGALRVLRGEEALQQFVL